MRYGFIGKHPGFTLLSPGAGSTPAYRTSEAIPSRPRPRLWCRRGQLHSTDAARVGAHAALMYGAGLCSFSVFSPTGSVGSIPPCRARGSAVSVVSSTSQQTVEIALCGWFRRTKTGQPGKTGIHGGRSISSRAAAMRTLQQRSETAGRYWGSNRRVGNLPLIEGSIPSPRQ